MRVRKMSHPTPPSCSRHCMCVNAEQRSSTNPSILLFLSAWNQKVLSLWGTCSQPEKHLLVDILFVIQTTQGMQRLAMTEVLCWPGSAMCCKIQEAPRSCWVSGLQTHSCPLSSPPTCPPGNSLFFFSFSLSFFQDLVLGWEVVRSSNAVI